MVFSGLVAPFTSVSKVVVFGESEAGEVPVPRSVTICGLDWSESVIVNKPFWSPICIGLNVISIAQFVFAATVPAQVERDTENSALLMITAPIVNAALSIVSVTVFGAALLPTIVSGKVIAVGARCTSAPGEFVLSSSGFRQFWSCSLAACWPLSRPVWFGLVPVLRVFC